MKILAIEQSTVAGSAAILEDNTVLSEKTWDETGIRNQQLFSVIRELLDELSVEPSDIDTYAVGLGPGSFSGIRIALSAARGLALPGRKPVIGISSGEILAMDIMNEKDVPEVTVIGDARRKRFWLARFERTNECLKIKTAYSLIGIDELSEALKNDPLIVSPDWDRIGEELKKLSLPNTTIIEEKRMPRARIAGKLALRRINSNQPLEKPTPVYLHPPVFVEPKFT
ncbi:tRNA (adenosine(37)-N6)-threonylcarbamoyltransferase complex dimerization subunit type 1 TsaB [Verrucomicrobiota bacterium]